MLLTNLSQNHRLNGRPTGVGVHLAQNFKMANKLNILMQTDPTNVFKYAALSSGTEVPYAYMLAMKGGEMSATTMLNGTGALSGTMILTRDLAASLSGAGTLSGSMALITNLVATLAGSGTLGGSLSLSLAMTASIGGSGSLSGTMGLIINMMSTLAGAGSITGNLKGTARLEANIYVNSGTASLNEQVAAFWGAIANSYNDPGTMGEKLNDAGSASNPWADTSTYAAGTKGALLKDAADSAELASIK